MSSWPRSYSYGFAAGLLIGGGGVGLLAGTWFAGTTVVQFVESHPELEAGINGAIFATVAVTLIFAWVDGDPEVDSDDDR